MVDVATGLISHWRLEEASGSRADAKGTNTLADNNGVTSSPGKQGTAAHFAAASGQYLSIPDNASLSMGDLDFMLGAWVFGDTLGGGGPLIMGKYAGFSNEYALWFSSISFRFSLIVSSNGGGGGQVILDATSMGAPVINTWYYVLGWHDSVGNTLNIQVNNGTVDSMAHSAGVFDGTAPFQIGALGGPTQYWDGRIDEPSVWKNRILAPADRTWLYNAGAGQPWPWTPPAVGGPRMLASAGAGT